MIAAGFAEENMVLHPPPGVPVDEVGVMNVHKGNLSDGTPVIISCWKVTKEELEEIGRTGRVWVLVRGETTPPVGVTGFCPFEREEQKT
jgi:hypothetical protein